MQAVRLQLAGLLRAFGSMRGEQQGRSRIGSQGGTVTPSKGVHCLIVWRCERVKTINSSRMLPTLANDIPPNREIRLQSPSQDFAEATFLHGGRASPTVHFH